MGVRGNDGGEGEGMLWQMPAWASHAVASLPRPLTLREGDGVV